MQTSFFLGVIAGSFFAVLIFLILVCLTVFILLRRPDIIRSVLHLLHRVSSGDYVLITVLTINVCASFPTVEESHSLVAPKGLEAAVIKRASECAFKHSLNPP